MVHRAGSREPPDGGRAPPAPRAPARWAVYGLTLTAGLGLFAVIPADETPDAPLHSHQHVMLTTRAPANVWWAPTLRQPSAHMRTSLAPEPGHHEMPIIRLSPRQLSLAKW